MATRFEVLLTGMDLVRSRSIAEEAFDEIERVERLMSRYRSESDISRINRSLANKAIRISSDTFHLLQKAREFSEITRGAFDPTIGTLMTAWGLDDGVGREPSPEELAHIRNNTGWSNIVLREDDLTVQISRPGLALDLGGIAKGHALDRAAQLIQEAGVRSALIHGGTSTVVAIGTPDWEAGWPISLATPTNKATPTASAPYRFLLKDESLSMSASWGKWIRDPSGSVRGHVLNPSDGRPVPVDGWAVVIAPNGITSDALSTALLSGGTAIGPILSRMPQVRWLLNGVTS